MYVVHIKPVELDKDIQPCNLNSQQASQGIISNPLIPASELPSELPTLPQSHINTPQVPNSRPVFENSHKECIDQIDLKLNSLNTFIDHELSVLCDKMDSLPEGLLDVLTNKQHMENKNMNTLQ